MFTTIIIAAVAFVGGAVLAVMSPKVYAWVQSKVDAKAAATTAAAAAVVAKQEMVATAIRKDPVKIEAAITAYSKTL